MIRAYQNELQTQHLTGRRVVYCRGGRIIVLRDLFVNYRDVPNRDEARGKTERDEAQGSGVHVGRGECTQTCIQIHMLIISRILYWVQTPWSYGHVKSGESARGGCLPGGCPPLRTESQTGVKHYLSATTVADSKNTYHCVTATFMKITIICLMRDVRADCPDKDDTVTD